MTAFATAQDLATFLGHDVDTARANLLLEQSAGIIRGYTQQTFDAASTTAALEVAADHVILPERPIISVETVSSRDQTGTLVNVGGWWWDGLHTVYWNALGSGAFYRPDLALDFPYNYLSAYGYTYGYQTRQLVAVIAYTHGYATIPQPVKDICMGMAGRVYETPAAGAITQERIGTYMYKVAEVRGEGRLLALQTDEKETLDRYKVTGNAGTVTLR